MVTTYYMFVAGLISELFVRVAPLHAFAMATAHTAVVNVTMTPAARMTQRTVMTVYLLIVLWRLVRVALHRRRARRLAAAAAA